MHRTIQLLPISIILLIVGCDEREMTRQANEHAARQAEQNRDMAKLNEQVAEGTKRLVESDARMREEFLEAHRDLEVERKEIAGQRHRDPIIADAIKGTGILIACMLPVVLAIYVVRNASQRTANDELADLLIQDIARDQPLLLPKPQSDCRALSNEAPSLPAE